MFVSVSFPTTHKILLRAPFNLVEKAFSSFDMLFVDGTSSVCTETLIGALVGSEESSLSFVGSVVPLNCLVAMCEIALSLQTLKV
jgi:hypothetical protein